MLYHVSEDFSEAQDLAGRQPDRLKELQILFDQEAKRNSVYPLGAASSAGQPSLTEGKRRFVYLPSESRIPVANVPPFNASYRMSADVIIPERGAQGMLATFGDRAYGFAWYVKDGHMVYENKAHAHHETIRSRIAVPHGKVQLTYEFVRDTTKSQVEYDPNKGMAGTGRLYFNKELVGEEKLPLVQFFRHTSLYVCRSAGSPVSDAYAQPFRFTGTLEKITVNLD